MKMLTEDRNRIFEEATRWLSLFKDGTAERAAFFAWLAESPRHVEELSFALALSEEIAELTPEQRAEIERLAGDPSAPGHSGMQLDGPSETDRLPPNVIPLGKEIARDKDTARESSGRVGSLSDAEGVRTKARFWSRRPVAAGLAASVCLALLAAWWLGLGPFGWHTYTTSIGEQRALTLSDGSLVQLNTLSRLKVRFTADSRELRLLDGEALFKVQHEAARPFRVQTDDAVIQAIGTQFNVYRRQTGTSVSVLEGVVQIEAAASSEAIAAERVAGEHPATGQNVAIPRGGEATHITRVAAGEKVEVASGGEIMRREALNPAVAVAWQQRRFVFHDDTLADIAEEFNRYNKSPQIRIYGDTARAQRFAGTFDVDAPEALIAALAANPTLAIERGPEEIVIRVKER